MIALESVNAVEVFLVKDILGGTSGQYGLSEAVAGGAAVLGALAISLVRGVLALALGGGLGVVLGPRTTFVSVGVVGLCIAAAAVRSLRRVPAEPEPVTEPLA